MTEIDRERRGPCIVVGYDGSGASRAAVRLAAARAGATGRLVVVLSMGTPAESRVVAGPEYLPENPVEYGRPGGHRAHRREDARVDRRGGRRDRDRRPPPRLPLAAYAVAGVMKVIRPHVSEGEVEDVLAALPGDIRDLLRS